MIRNKFYYGIKPLVPAFVRRGVRRWFAFKKRPLVSATWPILPGSERPLDGWPGWPLGKKFAFVLTHDVEGPDGVAKCRKLMELEMKWGFRSSFNFIPEGDYRVSRELRDELTRNGFEVGVHDLHHDGKLYRSRESFGENASRINHYLKEWGAVGFRAGFMLHRLDWLADLEIQYDASTFDTDPFEPQPDGVRTIFPFWKECANGRGYVELPYTLPQDSTLFVLFAERTPEIWLKKLDWVAAQGGMGLVNVHPDYLQFPGEPDRQSTFPVEIYESLLQHVRQRIDECWHCLPKEMAAFAAPLKLQPPPSPRRICMVTYSYYMADARVTRYAEALAQRGDHVDVVSLRRWEDKPDREISRKVNIIRLQPRVAKTEKSALSYLWPTLRFLLSSSFWIARSHFRQPYDLLHIHNIPDFLVFAAAYPRLKGAKVILDIHDIVPEFYASKFGVNNNSPAVALLKWTEHLSARNTDHVIMSNHLWLDKYASRTGTAGRCSVFINNVDRSIFQPRPKTRTDGKFIIIFPGGLQWHQGLDIALRAFHKINGQMPEAEFHIYGDGNMKQSLMDLSRELGLQDKVRFFNPIPVREIAEVMANADLGVVPKRADSFGNEAYSTKIMEFMSLGVPVIVSGTKIDRYYFNDSVVRFFESGNSDSLAAAMQEVIGQHKTRQEMVVRALEYADHSSWESRKGDYLNLVDSLCLSNGNNGS